MKKWTNQPRLTTDFEPGYGHTPTNRKRARAAANALLAFADVDGRIPVELIPEALKRSRLATDRTWTTEHVRVLAHQLRLLPDPRR